MDPETTFSQMDFVAHQAMKVVELYADVAKPQKHEVLLYAQACQTLQGYFRMFEFKFEESHES